MFADRSSRRHTSCMAARQPRNEHILSSAQRSVRKHLRQDEKMRTPGARLIRRYGRSRDSATPWDRAKHLPKYILAHIPHII